MKIANCIVVASASQTDRQTDRQRRSHVQLSARWRTEINTRSYRSVPSACESAFERDNNRSINTDCLCPLLNAFRAYAHTHTQVDSCVFCTHLKVKKKLRTLSNHSSGSDEWLDLINESALLLHHLIKVESSDSHLTRDPSPFVFIVHNTYTIN